MTDKKIQIMHLQLQETPYYVCTLVRYPALLLTTRQVNELNVWRNSRVDYLVIANGGVSACYYHLKDS